MDDKKNIPPALYSLAERILTLPWKLAQAGNQKARVSQIYWDGFLNYLHDFMVPFWIALRSFSSLETNKLRQHPLGESIQDYLELLQFNLQVAEKGAESTLKAMNSFHTKQGRQAFSALTNTLFYIPEEDINQHLSRQTRLLKQVVYAYPQAIKEIGSEFGFHFEEDGYKKAAETDRFSLYQVLPNKAGVKTRENGKPIIIIHPYVLGPNILCFLPNEDKSYVHCFANQGLPTYVRILKPIEDTPAVQTMTGEDDASEHPFLL